MNYSESIKIIEKKLFKVLSNTPNIISITDKFIMELFSNTKIRWRSNRKKIKIIKDISIKKGYLLYNLPFKKGYILVSPYFYNSSNILITPAGVNIDISGEDILNYTQNRFNILDDIDKTAEKLLNGQTNIFPYNNNYIEFIDVIIDYNSELIDPVIELISDIMEFIPSYGKIKSNLINIIENLPTEKKLLIELMK